jgi:hypothetical protein
MHEHTDVSVRLFIRVCLRLSNVIYRFYLSTYLSTYLPIHPSTCLHLCFTTYLLDLSNLAR